MFATADFVSRYEKLTDDELLNIYNDIGDYSEEAKKALAIVIERRGGEEKLVQQGKVQAIYNEELTRVIAELNTIFIPGTDISFYKKMITSDVLSSAQLDLAIEEAFFLVRAAKLDREVKPDTIVKSIVAGTIAAVVCGVLYGLHLIFSERIFVILIIGQAILCYAIIKLFTRKSYNNLAVFVASAIAFLASFGIGTAVYEMYK